MNPMLRYYIQLELMGRQPQQGNADRVLVVNNFDTSVTWRSQFSAVILQLLCASAQLKLLKHERFSNFLTKVKYPPFGRASLYYR